MIKYTKRKFYDEYKLNDAYAQVSKMRTGKYMVQAGKGLKPALYGRTGLNKSEATRLAKKYLMMLNK